MVSLNICPKSLSPSLLFYSLREVVWSYLSLFIKLFSPYPPLVPAGPASCQSFSPPIRSCQAMMHSSLSHTHKCYGQCIFCSLDKGGEKSCDIWPQQFEAELHSGDTRSHTRWEPCQTSTSQSRVFAGLCMQQLSAKSNLHWSLRLTGCPLFSFKVKKFINLEWNWQIG